MQQSTGLRSQSERGLGHLATWSSVWGGPGSRPPPGPPYLHNELRSWPPWLPCKAGAAITLIGHGPSPGLESHVAFLGCFLHFFGGASGSMKTVAPPLCGLYSGGCGSDRGQHPSLIKCACARSTHHRASSGHVQAFLPARYAP